MTDLERWIALERIKSWFKAYESWLDHLYPSDRAIMNDIDELIEDVPIEFRAPEEMPWKCAVRRLVPIKGDDNVTHLIASKDFPDLGVFDRIRRELGVKHPLGRMANAIAEGYGKAWLEELAKERAEIKAEHAKEGASSDTPTLQHDA